MSDFLRALRAACDGHPALKPPNRVSVTQGAATHLKIVRPGGGSGPYRPDETPYMGEPMNMLASRVHSAVCFVGPAQTGKTLGLGEGWLAHAVCNDPGDMLIVQMTQDKAREYSRQRIDRAIRHSDDLRAMQTGSSKDDNLHDKVFRNGMMLKIAWPTATNLSSTSYRYVFGTDYDRWNGGKEDVDGEGDGFTLMRKRTTTFLSRGMVSVESSPGRAIVDPHWKPSTPHEAPPVGTDETGSGILGIYNRGDRRRWYWKCTHCGEWLEAAPGLGLFRLPPEEELLEGIRDLDIDTFSRQFARVICPSGCLLMPSDRAVLNRGGLWLPDGASIDAHDRISGNPRTSDIASFWLGGAAAAYTTWETLIRKYLQALLDYEMTGNELPLQTTINTDQGVPYMSRHLAEAARAASQEKVVEDDMPRCVVPDAARCLLAMVDVQGGANARFEVAVHAIGEHKEQWLVDRYPIKWSKRAGVSDEFAPIDPAAHPEDWDVLTEKVVAATYRTNDEGRELRVHAVAVDFGGEEGVSANAAAWWRRLRSKGLHRNVRLTKGEGRKVDWTIKETEVGPTKDVPLLLFASNVIKDMVAAGRRRRVPGPGFYHWPKPKGPANPNGWLVPAFFDELDAEVRDENGVWQQVKKRNEALDHCVMALVLCAWLGMDKRGWWENPPSWAKRLPDNSGIVTPETRRREKERAAQPERPPLTRRTASAL